MKTSVTLLALLLSLCSIGQAELTSIGLNAKIDRFKLKDAKMMGLEYTLQAVFNQHLIVNAEYSTAGEVPFQEGWLDDTELGVFPYDFSTIGGNLGYRFTPDEKFVVDLMVGSCYYQFKERIVYDTVEVPNGWFPYTDAVDRHRFVSGVGGNMAVRTSWIFSKYVGLNSTLGVQTLDTPVPYIQFGIEVGKLR